MNITSIFKVADVIPHKTAIGLGLIFLSGGLKATGDVTGVLPEVHPDDEPEDLGNQIIETMHNAGLWFTGIGATMKVVRMEGGGKVAAMVAALAFAIGMAPPALANDRGLVHDGSIDLRVLLLGKTTAVDFGVGGIGVRVDPDEWSEIDAEPTHISTLKAGCSWGFARSLIGLKCEEE